MQRLNISSSMWIRLVAVVAAAGSLNCIPVDPQLRQEAMGAERLERRFCTERVAVTAASPVYRTPTRLLADNEIPTFGDDLDFVGLETAIDRQMARFRSIDLNGSIYFAQDRYSLKSMADGLESFRALMRKAKRCLVQSDDSSRPGCFKEFNADIRAKFNVYQPQLVRGDARFGETDPVLFTGYYTPRVEVMTKPTGDFQFPIYMKPSDEWLSRVGRYQIDFRNELRHKGLELYYAKNLFDLYLLHLEGGGRLVIVDKPMASDIYVSYAGTNHREWRFISVLMVDKNWISDPSIDTQRQFIENNPTLQPEIFSYCPGYVYFRELPHPPLGSDDVPLTDNRSIATDTQYYAFKGGLVFVKAQRPKDLKSADLMPFSRFALDQDTGGAIKGKARVDFYFGEGAYAEQAAHTLKGRGSIFFLMPKN